jgi:6-pyruvoyltetrahydropterin/6-carboxytetrahydropterin synthase
MYVISREIGIDAGHRVPGHESKCRHLHGHRYRIVMHASAPRLQTKGAEEGMIKDFSFLKTIMMDKIDALFDHGLILKRDDPLIEVLLPGYKPPPSQDVPTICHAFYYVVNDVTLKVVLMPTTPTAENLAKLFYTLCSKPVKENGAQITKVDVWETPNCVASYTPEKENHVQD